MGLKSYVPSGRVQIADSVRCRVWLRVGVGTCLDKVIILRMARMVIGFVTWENGQQGEFIGLNQGQFGG